MGTQNRPISITPIDLLIRRNTILQTDVSFLKRELKKAEAELVTLKKQLTHARELLDGTAKEDTRETIECNDCEAQGKCTGPGWTKDPCFSTEKRKRK